MLSSSPSFGLDTSSSVSIPLNFIPPIILKRRRQPGIKRSVNWPEAVREKPEFQPRWGSGQTQTEQKLCKELFATTINKVLRNTDWPSGSVHGRLREYIRECKGTVWQSLELSISHSLLPGSTPGMPIQSEVLSNDSQHSYCVFDSSLRPNIDI